MRIVATALVATLPGLASAGSLPPPADFFAGSYAVVGQGVEWGAPYSGTGTIEPAGEAQLTLTRRIGDDEIVETGRVEHPIHPPEPWMLTLYDRDGALVGGCLWQIDLDNYARLTCQRGAPGVYPDMPGLEAWFPLQ